MARTRPARPADPLIAERRLLAVGGRASSAPVEGPWDVVVPRVTPGPAVDIAEDLDVERLEAALIGDDIENPVAIAQTIRQRDPTLQVVLLVPTASHEAMRRSFVIRSVVGDVWTLPADASPEALTSLLERAGDATRRRRELRQAMSGINARLGAAREQTLATRQRLEISDRYLATLLASAPDAIVSLDAAGRITSWNDAAETLLGPTRAAVLGQPLADRFPSWVRDELDSLLAEVRAGRPVRGERITCVGRDGALIEAEATMGAIPYAGAGTDAASIVMILREITGEVLAEEEMRLAQIRERRMADAARLRAAELDAIIRSIGDPVLVVDVDGTVVLRNPAADRLAPEPIRTYEELLQRFAEGEQAPRSGQSTPETVELAARDSDRWFELRTYPVPMGRDVDPSLASPTDSPSPGGDAAAVTLGEAWIRGTVVVVRDVTAARQAQAARDLFLGVISHELRTPITTIYGASRMLNRVSSDDPAQSVSPTHDLMTDIEVEADRLYRLVEDLLVLTRVERGALEVIGEPVLLQRLVPRVVDAEQVRWPEATFRTEGPPDLPPVRGEATYVEQVLRNFLDNAAKYGGSGTGIEVLMERAGDEVIVRVLDDGPGIPESEIGRVFGLFYRSERTARTTKGAGIGLFVCRELIGAMGGRVWARSGKERGAELAFALPVEGD